jgi:hypothetical protein
LKFVSAATYQLEQLLCQAMQQTDLLGNPMGAVLAGGAEGNHG